MTRLFDERERAAESLFMHGQEKLFLRRRRGVRALAAWASQAMRHDSLTTELYELDLTAAMVKGADDEALLKRVAATLRVENITVSLNTARTVLAYGAV